MLETKIPREQAGRDTISRFKAQIKSAAMASLSILEGKEIDRVYCDLHDDFVIRKRGKDGYSYIFFQVKTKNKENHNWSLNEIFGLKKGLKDQAKQDSNNIKNSFIGKLLLHTVVFDQCCNSVVFQTNIHSGDDVKSLLSDIESGDFENKFTKVLIERFNDLFSEELDKGLTQEKIKKNLSKLKLQTDVQHLKNDDETFEFLANGEIYKFSEIELSHSESKEILMKLLELIQKKSSGIIKDFTESSIDKLAGVTVEDLLSILSISKDAYLSLLKSGDDKAIKNASIIQRTLESTGADLDMVEYCSRCKTEWDIWLRQNRHVLQEIDLLAITSKIRELLASAQDYKSSVCISNLKKPVEDLRMELDDEDILYDLSLNLILGGVFSELVKSKS